ncbi:MAG TPA: discoidin domain-containing protein [Bryobacteraceae bacterium]|nr:discoidin domain-containing protein [Bryobacteraceae bacterium]
MQVAQILFAAAFTGAVSLFLGKLLLKLLRIQLYRSEEIFLGFVLGAAGLSTLVFLASVSGLAYAWVFFAAGCAIIAIAWWQRAIHFTAERLPPVPRNWMLLFVILYAAFGSVYLVAALLPEASADGNLYHVALPALYLREHRIPAITTNMLADLSEGVEMLYLFAFSFGRHSATAMVHLLFTLAAPWLILSYARRIGLPAAGVVGGLLFFMSPTVAMFGTVPYADLALSAVVFGLFYFLQIWWVEQNDRLLVPAGILAGFAYGIKYTAGISVIYALGVIMVRRFRSPQLLLKPALLLAVCAAALIAPWVIKDTIVAGNPIAPFGNKIFPNPYVYPSMETVYAGAMGSLRGMRLWNWPYEATVRGARTQGALGPMFLLTPLALLAFWIPGGRRLLAAAAVFLLPCLVVVDARFFLPVLTFVSLALGMALSRWRIVAVAVVLLHAAGATPPVMVKYISRASPRLTWPDWRAALRLTPESDYLEKRVDAYGLGLLMDANVAPQERVFSFQAFQQAYHSRQVIAEWQSAFGVRLGEPLRAAINQGIFPTNRHQFSFASLSARRARLVQVSKSAAEDWTISELRIFENGMELPRVPEWRLRASPNPWDVQSAFDNSPLTRWSTRQRPSPGDFLEVDFGKTVSLDQVIAECLPNEATMHVALQVQTDPGQWRTVDARHEVALIPVPARMRRAAIEELERQGVRWLAISDLDPGSRDLLMRQAQWGIEFVGAKARYKLYHLQ